jgi:hypothetical protein
MAGLIIPIVFILVWGLIIWGAVSIIRSIARTWANHERLNAKREALIVKQLKE